MIPFSFFTIYLALAAVYFLFLVRVRQGLKNIEEDSLHQVDPAITEPFSVSVLVAMRNEQSAVGTLISSLKKQDYAGAELEFILVDDHSDDETYSIAQSLCGDDERFSLLQLADGSAGKKAALHYAISQAKGDIIVTTDADCQHQSEWLTAIIKPYYAGADLVAGPVVISDRSSLFSRIQALDFLGYMGVGAGLFGVGHPRLCNGANFSYRKELFSRAGGFSGNDHISSGDDEYLMHKFVYELGASAVFVAEQEAIVTTPHVPGLWQFFLQRSRWASKGARYSDTSFVMFLVLLFCFFIFAAISPIIAFLSPLAFIAAIVLYGAKSYIELQVLAQTARILKQPIRILDFGIAELLHPFYLIAVTLAGTMGLGRWKNRKLIQKKQ
jgi:cellulose synthase/poly-beta-1,6-N-acetylglucosamine synthase-like glycosyltransferase